MDLLFERYASPFLLINNLIRVRRFADFVDSFNLHANDEKEEERTWAFFLHKVHDLSYADFKQQRIQERINNKPIDYETAIINSNDILNNFVPD